MNTAAIMIGKAVSWFSKTFGIGTGATWSGEIALRISPNILADLSRGIRKGIILIAGTNGKTTTTLMIKNILESQGETVAHNDSGANLLNGIVSTLLIHRTADWGIFEVDENALPIILSYIRPKIVVLLNLFRDQLDRYGEIDTIANSWLRALRVLKQPSGVIINADDPQLAYIGMKLGTNVSYFGIQKKALYLSHMQHATDSIYCPRCGEKIFFHGVYFSHLGDWKCKKCGLLKPSLSIAAADVTSPIEGVYNIYNTLAATLIGKYLSISQTSIRKSLVHFTPAFGRMERISYKNKDIVMLLSKNPTGFNEAIRTVLSSQRKGPMMLLLNDRIPDGTDVSWIWDVDFEHLENYSYPIVISGDRYLDMGLRIKYAITKPNVQEINNMYCEKDLHKAIEQFVCDIRDTQTGWILATYSAMLDARKILTGKKIL